MIRFLKPETAPKPATKPMRMKRAAPLKNRLSPQRPRIEPRWRALVAQAAMMGGMGGGMGGMGGAMGGMGADGLGLVPDANSRSGAAALTRAKIITTSDKEIIGTIHIPTDLKIELDFASLTLAPARLRSITFTDAHPRSKQPATGELAPRTRNRPQPGPRRSTTRAHRVISGTDDPSS